MARLRLVGELGESLGTSKVSSGGELTDDSSALLTLKTKVRRFPDSSDEESGKDSDNREDIDSLAVKAAGYDDVPVEPVDMKRLVGTKVDNKNAKTQSAKDLKKIGEGSESVGENG
ncbi:hypothetical protein PI124_g24083 [Phytophthora idaei]|nr:hypothetical protein PI125_g26423 [Phytophthora idaei]KAG3230820.1 hypothetical protein PI124_g24083 [Phytophthora idaei]